MLYFVLTWYYATIFGARKVHNCYNCEYKGFNLYVVWSPLVIVFWFELGSCLSVYWGIKQFVYYEANFASFLFNCFMNSTDVFPLVHTYIRMCKVCLTHACKRKAF